MTKLKDECSRSKNDYNKINIEWKNFSQDLKEIKMSLAKMANNKELDCMGLIELVAKRIKDLTDEIANLQAYNNQLYNSK